MQSTMITLTVVTFNGAPLQSPPSATFDELGGTLGRAESNQLVLPDEQRVISRMHAQVVFRRGSYAIIARGANAILVNGQALENGHEASLSQGDQLQVGPYLLQVQLGASGARTGTSADPLAGLLGAAPDLGTGVVPGRAPIDPLSAYAAMPARAPAPAATPLGGIPDDWDPFAAPVEPARPAPGLSRTLGLGLGPAPASSSLIPGLESGAVNATGARGDSLDALFGLGPNSGDPLHNSALADPAARPNMAASADPLRSLMSAPQASAETRGDTGSDLNLAFNRPLPMSRDAAFGAVAPGAAADDGAQTMVRPAGRPVDPGATHIGPPMAAGGLGAGGRPYAAPPGYAPSLATLPEDIGLDLTPGMPPAPAAPVAAVAARQASAEGALLAAFVQGLGSPAIKIDALTPEFMQLIGQMLHEAVRGTVDLLVARATLKREVKAEATTIGTRENNPLKFSPNGDAALQHLLAPSLRGFMAPAPAMRDAYDDLRAHQFGMIAGMRAALEGVMDRFDPVQLEAQLGKNSGLGGLLAGSRKAKMWELFVERHAKIREEASEDFQSLFGAAFTQAYTEYNAKLKAGQA